ncbi:MAG: DUF3782 domain-containing protein [Prochlorothrix sp.]
MTTPVTIEDIYRLFERSRAEDDRRSAEADRRSAEADRRSAEADRRLSELERLFEQSRLAAERRSAEADRRSAEADRRSAEADRRSEEVNHRLSELERLSVESRREMAEFRQAMAQSRQDWSQSMAEFRQENDRQIQEMRKMVAGLSDRWGVFVENLVRSSAVKLFQERGIDVTEIHPGMRVRRGDLEMQIDVFVVNGQEAVAIEVKSHLTREYVDEFLAQLPNFKAAFPAYRDYTVYGAVAGIDIDQGIDRYAYRQGLFVLRQTGDFVEIANDDRFEPIAW